MTFRALMATEADEGITTHLVDMAEDQLMHGDVLVRVEYSTVNFKDAYAITGLADLIAQFPMIPGIDFAGVVESSAFPGIEPGDRVVLNGWGVGQRHFGGYAQKARVNGEWLVKIPELLSTKDAMAIGTAGYTAMLCVLTLERGGITPESGDILVTAASGGVGSISIALLSSLGFRVVASSGRPENIPYLMDLGASQVIDRSILSDPGEPLGTPKWAGAIDSVGGYTLANVLSQLRYGGVVAACGVVQGWELPATLFPFIRRNITLVGIDSVTAPMSMRQAAWNRLAVDLDLDKLEQAIEVAGLSDIQRVIDRVAAGNARGRTVIDVNA